MKLHKNQKIILDFLETNQGKNIALQKICDKFDLKSRNLVGHHINQLIKKGYIIRGNEAGFYYVLNGQNKLDLLEKRIEKLESIIKGISTIFNNKNKEEK